MLKMLLCFLLFASSQYGNTEDIFYAFDEDIVLDTQRIILAGYPEAFNPSLAKWDRGFLLTFRNCPDPCNQPWLSEIGVVILDGDFRPVAQPQILSTRIRGSKTPPQSEDARFFTYRGKIFLIYNDNVDEIFYDGGKRRDLFIAELMPEEPPGQGRFKLAPPLRLRCEEKYNAVYQQKNWIPFEWQNSLFFVYSIHPHEILGSNLRNGACYSLYKSSASFDWGYGILRGSSDAQLIDGEYLAFFHSGIKMASPASPNVKVWHYFMGAYTFSPNPPFEMTRITEAPILSDSFYTFSVFSDYEKKVIFPGGFTVDGPRIYLAYGKDDREIWIATLDREQLKKNLKSVRP